MEIEFLIKLDLHLMEIIIVEILQLLLQIKGKPFLCEMSKLWKI